MRAHHDNASRRTLRGAIRLGLIALACLSLPAAAGQQIDGAAYPRGDVDDLAPGYRHWLEEQVSWIITDAERDVFLRLDSDPKRDIFIEAFWRNRDPSPDTSRNEYQELHYDRLDYVNGTFGRDTPRSGSFTDRGRIYILLGEPRGVTRVASGQEVVASEVWFYDADPSLGVPPNFYLIFFRETENAEYRLWSPTVDGPERLLTLAARQGLSSVDLSSLPVDIVVAAGPQQAAALARLRRADAVLFDAAVSLVPTERASGNAAMRSAMLLGDIDSLPDVLMPSADWASDVLTGKTESAVRFETLPVVAEAIRLMDPSGVTYINIAVRAAGDRLELRALEGRTYLSFELATNLRDGQGTPLRIGSPTVLDAPIPEDQVEQLDERDFQYLARRPSLEGAEVMEIALANKASGEFGRTSIDLAGPTPAGSPVEASRPFLLREVQNLGETPAAAPMPFQLGQLLLVPALDGPFPEGGAVGVFWQLRVMAGARPELQASFTLRDAAGAVVGQWASRIDAQRAGPWGVVNNLSRVSLAGVGPGAYVLECMLQGVEGRSIELPLRVVPADEHHSPIIYVSPTAGPGE